MVESKVERISFTPKREVLILGAPNKFTLRDKPECSILRPQRLMSNSPCRGFVWITRMMFGDQIHLEAPVGHADSFDLKGISEAIMMRNGASPMTRATSRQKLLASRPTTRTTPFFRSDA